MHVPQCIPSQKSKQPEKHIATPTNNILTRSPALIPYNDKEIEPYQEMLEDIQPCQTQRKYNLRERAVHIINSVILEETPNAKSISYPLQH
eukprot:2568350-Ditylum_brightwellii.AAC.1